MLGRGDAEARPVGDDGDVVRQAGARARQRQRVGGRRGRAGIHGRGPNAGMGRVDCRHELRERRGGAHRDFDDAARCAETE